MKIFDFHFNPKKEKNKIFNSFIYEPENAYERRVGNLYVIGEIRNVLPQNRLLLNKIADEIKKSYYSINTSSLEELLRTSLASANNFLEKEEKEDNVSWLGNLSLAAFNIKGLDISFSKIGKIKILLLRGEKIIDLSDELEVKEMNSDSKAFSNIVSGNLSPSDKLIVLTQSVFELISKNNLLIDLLSIFTKEINLKQADKEIKKILNNKEKLLEKLSGVFLLIELEKPEKETTKIKKPISSKESFLSINLPSFDTIRNQKILNKLTRINFSFLKKLTFPKKLPRPFIPKIKFNKINFTSLFSYFSPTKKDFHLKNINLKQSIILILIFFIILGVGNQLFKIGKEKEIERIEIKIREIQDKINEAENALAYHNEKKANNLYQEAWKDITTLSQDEKITLKDEIMETKQLIKDKLFGINKIEEIISPELFFEIEPKDIFPQKLIITGEDFFIANQESYKIWQIKNNELLLISDLKEFSLIESFNDYLLLFSPPNKISFLKNKEINNKNISISYSDPSIIDISSFGSNIYLVDQSIGSIIRVPFREEETLKGIFWLNKETEKLSNPKSMAIDGSIWIIDNNNSIKKYYKGELEKEINIETFPSLNQISKIITYSNAYYVYLLDPEENRIIIINKEGEVKKQLLFSEEKLLDFHLTETEESVYVLTSQGIYKIDIKL
jgi:hypothetical protein